MQCNITQHNKTQDNILKEWSNVYLIFTATCSTVTCSFTMDNVVDWAKYDGNLLTIYPGYGLSTWSVKKSVTFESCFESSPGTLFIKGSNEQYDTGTGI